MEEMLESRLARLNELVVNGVKRALSEEREPHQSMAKLMGGIPRRVKPINDVCQILFATDHMKTIVNQIGNNRVLNGIRYGYLLSGQIPPEFLNVLSTYERASFYLGVDRIDDPQLDNIFTIASSHLKAGSDLIYKNVILENLNDSQRRFLEGEVDSINRAYERISRSRAYRPPISQGDLFGFPSAYQMDRNDTSARKHKR